MKGYFNELTISIICFALALLILWRAWLKSGKKQPKPAHSFARHKNNPLMSPAPHSQWESGGTFNPTAVLDNEDRFHFLYRAVGADGVSRIGYASSPDGVSIDVHSPYPIFALLNPRANIPAVQDQRPNRVMYPSGGSWGGCEDPRAVRIEDKVYMTFNAFDGWDFIRIGVVSMKADNFFKRHWKWSKPLFISPKGQVNKNWVLFPEKIDGKFAILHSISPEVQIDYAERLEDLDSGKQVIKSQFGQKQARPEWDTWVRGAGPAPVKTERGWLVLYHATNKNEPHKYKLGALLLDLNNPKKVLARSSSPILSSEEWYENDWKPGVVYACGATVKDNTLYVYYGGGDKHVCLAHTPIKELLDWLIKHGAVNL